MKPLRSTDLRTRITISRSIDVPTGKGGFTTSWSTIARPWAEVTSLTGREAVLAQSLQGVSSYRIRIRWRGDINTADQISLGTKVLNVRAADDPDQRREQLVIIADSEGVRPE